MSLIKLAESGRLPDFIIRAGIRRLLAKRLKSLPTRTANQRRLHEAWFARQISNDPIALDTDLANEQHYEVPAEFFESVLGSHLKYSCCLFENESHSLDIAEAAMLRLTCQRAQLEDGMRILELGCGWGSLTCWMAEQYPNSEITAVTNSQSQQIFIERRAAERQLSNLQVVKADMRQFSTRSSFDRIMSIEMFEHMRNYQQLFQRLSQWLTPAGKAFVHVFCHRHTPYLFETQGTDNWMGQNFFTGGTMPSENLFYQFTDDLHIQQQWRVSGLHYWQTCQAWLTKLDHNRSTILRRLQNDLDKSNAEVQLQRWRMFFMACAELFRYRNGQEWFVSHYLFSQARSQKQVQHNLPADDRVLN